ncbi:Trimeric GatFAB AmidoTransferase(AdT) complex subunit [Coelomomyces lativittatus]|nr:Trimeric GatFAB AmidoTransferase(AdT) complex subunit [Coelomomyces lativittatus]
MIALGSDTGGSLRLPSSYCGLVSYKPSYGMISRYGLLSLAPSLDTLGWFTNDVQDTLYLSEWMLFDSSSTQVHASHDFTYQRRASSSSSSSSSCSSTPFRIGVPTSLNFTHLSSLTREGWSTCLQACSSIPSTTVVDLCSIWPPASLVLSVYHLLTACEAASVLATYMDGIRFGEPASLDPQGFESLVNMRKCIGWHAVTTKSRISSSKTYYQVCLQLRELWRHHFKRLFESIDFIILPTTPSHAPSFPFSHPSSEEDPSKIANEYLSDTYTVLPSLLGLPVITLPWVHPSNQASSFALQVVGPYGQDRLLLDFASKLMARLHDIKKI